MNDEMYGIKAERRFELCLEDVDRFVDLVRWGDYQTFMTDRSSRGVGENWSYRNPWFHGFIDPDTVTADPTDLSNYDVTYDDVSDVGAWSEKNYLFPFPYSELTMNPNIIQNPGW